jgi:hypothetical protein
MSWDWDCRDEMTGERMAIEVKRITNKNREEKASEIDKLLEQIKNGVAGQLTGTFMLSVHVPERYQFPFKGQPSNRNLLMEAICEGVKKCAKSLDIGETANLTQMVNRRLTSFKIPDDVDFELKKLSNEGSQLLVSPFWFYWDSIGFDSDELQEFEKKVSRANCQLGKSNADDAALVLIEEGHRDANPPELEDAFRRINKESYSKIRHVYFIRGVQVAEISIPVTQ